MNVCNCCESAQIESNGLRVSSGLLFRLIRSYDYEFDDPAEWEVCRFCPDCGFDMSREADAYTEAERIKSEALREKRRASAAKRKATLAAKKSATL